MKPSVNEFDSHTLHKKNRVFCGFRSYADPFSANKSSTELTIAVGWVIIYSVNIFFRKVKTMQNISRRAARECALKTLYGFEFSREADPADFFELSCSEFETASDEFSKKLFMTAASNLEEIDKIIEQNAKGWKTERLSKMTLSILRLCVCEMKYFDDIPSAVSMNEAVELAKIYDGDDAPAFINGIVNAVSKSL